MHGFLVLAPCRSALHPFLITRYLPPGSASLAFSYDDRLHRDSKVITPPSWHPLSSLLCAPPPLTPHAVPLQDADASEESHAASPSPILNGALKTKTLQGVVFSRHRREQWDGQAFFRTPLARHPSSVNVIKKLENQMDNEMKTEAIFGSRVSTRINEDCTLIWGSACLTRTCAHSWLGSCCDT